MDQNNLQGFQGIFFDEETSKKLIELQKNGLSENIKNMHITFNFGELEKYPDWFIGKDLKVKLVGYASDGKNSGFSVELPEEVKQFYRKDTIPHITVSIGEVDGEKGKPVDTAKLSFEDLENPIEITGRLGYFIFDKGLAINNSAFNQHTPDDDDAR